VNKPSILEAVMEESISSELPAASHRSRELPPQATCMTMDTKEHRAKKDKGPKQNTSVINTVICRITLSAIIIIIIIIIIITLWL
jgi:hypothetical protein